MRHIEINEKWTSMQPFDKNGDTIRPEIYYHNMMNIAWCRINGLLDKFKGKPNDISMEEVGLTKESVNTDIFISHLKSSEGVKVNAKGNKLLDNEQE